MKENEDIKKERKQTGVTVSKDILKDVYEILLEESSEEEPEEEKKAIHEDIYREKTDPPDNDDGHPCLSNWYLKIKKQKVFVNGYWKGKNIQWETEELIKPIGKRKIHTKGNFVFILKGKPSKKEFLEKGFSNDFYLMFKKGFPQNWKELLYNEKKKILLSQNKKIIQRKSSRIKIGRCRFWENDYGKYKREKLITFLKEKEAFSDKHLTEQKKSFKQGFNFNEEKL